ncbi:MAG: hypothetical protein ABI857_09550 [Acidobacteriota bacterium]
MANRNAEIGMDVERLFKNSFDDLSVIAAIKNRFGISGAFAKAFPGGKEGGKSDVLLRFADRTLSANIKAFLAGFNQITRMTINSFCSQFGLQDLRSILEKGAIRVASRSGRFILESDEPLIHESLTPIAKAILEYSLSRLENPELLVLYDRANNRMLLYDMREMLDNLDYEISFSKRGIIRIGRFFTIQRKGGNGVHSLHIEKTSLLHPGNNLQVKMNIRAFVKLTEPFFVYQPARGSKKRI